MRQHLRLITASGLLFILSIIAIPASFAQVKPTLPTGPPAAEPQQRPTQPQPVPQRQVQQPDSVQVQQEEEKPELKNRLYTGGSFGLQFGTFTSVQLSPILGFKATEKLWMGIGAVYQFRGSREVKLQNYGGKAFMQLEAIENFLVHAEYEMLNTENAILYQGGQVEKIRKTIGMPMAGLGYRQRIGERASSDLLVLYNFSDSPYSPYSNPVIRVNFNIPLGK
ncbi:hypothetical protein [Pontibacter vulgaris]|uniref:hypothetical protein n=1 Tax=Pontibacter vulgaris TaxID=2905679 RepID=UPI001FA80E20|nr:hypothetical protein [Pontibacter vulgaris]